MDRIERIDPDRTVSRIELTRLTPVEREEQRREREEQRRERERKRRAGERRPTPAPPPEGGSGIDFRV